MEMDPEMDAEMDIDIDAEIDMEIDDANIETHTTNIIHDNEPEEELVEVEEVEKEEEKETQVKDAIEMETKNEAGAWSVPRGKKKKHKNRNENDKDREKHLESHRTNKEKTIREIPQQNNRELPDIASSESNKTKADQTTDWISHPSAQTKKSLQKKKEKMKAKKQEKNLQNHGLEKGEWTTTNIVPDPNHIEAKTHIPQGTIDLKQATVKPAILSNAPYTRTTKPPTTQKNNINNASDSYPVQKDTSTGINIKINTNLITNVNTNSSTISPITSNSTDIGITLNNTISKEPSKPLVRPTRPPVANITNLPLAGAPMTSPVRLPNEIQAENKTPTVSNTATLTIPNNAVSYQDGLQHLLQSLYPPLPATTAIPTAVNWTPSSGSTFPIPYLTTPTAAITTFPNPLLFSNQSNGVNANLKSNVAADEYTIKDLSIVEQKDEWINFDLSSHSYPSSLWTLNLKSLKIHPDCSLDKLKVLMRAK